MTDLVAEYAEQVAFRGFTSVIDRLPLNQARVLDLGCSLGDMTHELSRRGAHVTGLDANQELLAAGRARHPGLDLRHCDLRDELPLLGKIDGIWCSFTAAYFPELTPALRNWTRDLVSGGFCVLVEVDDMFGHEPLAQSTRALLEGYVQQSLVHGRYDFRMGRRLHQALEAAGLQVEASFELPDRELAFAGPADPDVLTAWRARLRRMALLQAFCAERFADVERDLLQCLGSSEHRSTARVMACIARRP